MAMHPGEIGAEFPRNDFRPQVKVLMAIETNYETIVGLEIHVQLQTESKLFCSCSTEFGAPPNTQTCLVCAGLPGALPVLNRKALQLAIKAGLALNCDIERQTKWDRKHYFYPDLPKGYQISQFDQPICSGGYLELVDAQGQTTGDRVRLERAHLEEDAGKSLHDESSAGGHTRIDLNRAGTPLLEIVTKPDLRSATQAKNFLNELKLILTYIDVSDCNMQQGNLRVDANVNLWIDRDSGIATPIVEVKNLNSFRAVERAINFEAERQLKLFQMNGQTKEMAAKQTRGWDDVHQETVLQREKEESADYRYFPDPDLVGIETSVEMIAMIQDGIGTLPSQLRRELIDSYELSIYDADVLVRQGSGMIAFFRQCVEQVGNAGLVSNWIQQEVLRYLNTQDTTIESYPINATELSGLLNEINAKRIDGGRAKEVLNLMVTDNLDVATARQRLGIVDVDANEIDQLCQKLIAEYPLVAADVRSGNIKALGSLIGKARQCNPNANPGLVRQTLMKLLS